MAGRFWRALLGLVGAVAVILSAGAPAQAHRFVYVADNVAVNEVGQVSQYAIRAGGLLSPLKPPTVASRIGPFGVAISPDGKNAYVTTQKGSVFHGVSQYDIDPITGRLSPKGRATVPSGSSSQGIAVSPNGRSAYVANAGRSHDISQYNINPLNGRLVPKTPARVVVPQTPQDVAVTPDSKSAYVTTLSSGVFQYDIAASTGVLLPKDPPSVETGSGGGSGNVAVAPDGKSAYVTTGDPSDGFRAGTVTQYDIDPLSGELSLKTPPTVPAGVNPFGIAVTRDGKNAYAVNLVGIPGRTDTISQYTIDQATGRLSLKTPAKVAAGSGATDVAVTPDSKSAYVTNQLGNNVSQYNINPVSGALSPKTPATVAAGTDPIGIAVAATHPPPAP
jgi:DNA-binding beta-propeller fold protein YncE